MAPEGYRRLGEVIEKVKFINGIREGRGLTMAVIVQSI